MNPPSSPPIPTSSADLASPWARAGRLRARISALPLPRGLSRTLVWVGLGGAAAFALAPQLGALGVALGSLATADPLWAIVGIVLVAVRYAMAAISLQVAAARAIPFTPTLLIQLASAFVGRFTPEGVGWLVLNQRYLERSGLPRASALAAITLKVLAGAVTRLLIAIAVAASASSMGAVDLDLPAAVPAVLAAGLLVVTVAALVARARGAGVPARLAPAVAGARDLVAVLREPRRAALLFGTTAGLTLASGLILAASVRAFGFDVSLVDLFAVYLAGTAIASLSPTPGNLGAVELALSAGLTAIGVPAATSLAAVLLFRLLTFWLPILPGFVAFRYLQAEGRL